MVVYLKGFFIGYCIRYDEAKKIYIYEILSVATLLISFSLWLLLEYLTFIPWPLYVF